MVVVGSINMDLVARAARMPAPGETVLGTSFATTRAARDPTRRSPRRRPERTSPSWARWATTRSRSNCARHRGRGSGRRTAAGGARPQRVAAITVDSSGQNSIIVVPGANSRVVDLTDDELAAIADADVLLCQLEIPLDTVTAGARHAARTRDRRDPQSLSGAVTADGLVDAVDVLVVNETEERQLGEDALTRGAARGHDSRRRRRALPRTRRRATPGRRPLGRRGRHTGAGDAFAGALASAWSRGPLAALTFACARARSPRPVPAPVRRRRRAPRSRKSRPRDA